MDLAAADWSALARVEMLEAKEIWECSLSPGPSPSGRGGWE
jgi:hypothetical protein